jgi:hypothetical protein
MASIDSHRVRFLPNPHSSGFIDQQEFIDGITKDPQLLDVIGIDCNDPADRVAVLQGFNEIDNDGGGDISLDELKNFIQVIRAWIIFTQLSNSMN